MTKAEDLILKDSDLNIIAFANGAPKGRKYNENYARQPGGIRIDELALGTQLACIAITDDKEGTLAKTGQFNPWQVEAMKIITGSKEEAHKPLSHILDKHFGLTCDAHIDVSGFQDGVAIDTQGYIAHNDENIVVAFRCTTSVKDWITNLTFSTSEWNVEKDMKGEKSGILGTIDNLCCNESYKPKVHTGFYKNFLNVVPLLKKHVVPLLERNARPRKLYIVGHSLGAGIAAMTGCYFLLNHDWVASQHRLVNIMVGSPRPCHESMAKIVDEKLALLRPLDAAVMCNVTLNDDIVPTVPPAWFEYSHIGTKVFITEDGDVLINPNLNNEQILDVNEVHKIGWDYPELPGNLRSSSEMRSCVTEYREFIQHVPSLFKDHMPDFYLKPLVRLFEKVYGLPASPSYDEESEAESSLHKELPGVAGHFTPQTQTRYVAREQIFPAKKKFSLRICMPRKSQISEEVWDSRDNGH